MQDGTRNAGWRDELWIVGTDASDAPEMLRSLRWRLPGTPMRLVSLETLDDPSWFDTLVRDVVACAALLVVQASGPHGRDNLRSFLAYLAALERPVLVLTADDTDEDVRWLRDELHATPIGPDLPDIDVGAIAAAVSDGHLRPFPDPPPPHPVFHGVGVDPILQKELVVRRGSSTRRVMPGDQVCPTCGEANEPARQTCGRCRGSLVTASIAGGERAPEPRPDAHLRLTVYRPPFISPDSWHDLVAFVHRADVVAAVAERAAQLLGRAAADGIAAASSGMAVDRGSLLRIEPWISEGEINPAAIELRWQEALHEAAFRLTTHAPEGERLLGSVRVFLGALLLAEAPFEILVVSQAELDRYSGGATDAITVNRYRSVFASYSHRDRAIVERIAETARVLGDQFLVDVEQLRTGERWSKRLEELIRQADAFQLFWSKHSMRSPHVRREWEYALALGREGFVRPVYWQEPRPTDPPDLPPPELDALHFAKLTIDDGSSTGVIAIVAAAALIVVIVLILVLA